jgi:hypothetical protein
MNIINIYQKSIIMDYYSSLHKKYIEPDAVDIVSSENIQPHGRHYIMYLRLTSQLRDGVMHHRIPSLLIPYDTQSAYHTFVTNRVKMDPETRLPLNPGFIDRIKLYKEAMTLGPVEHIGDLFMKYLKGNALSPTERLMLRSSLHLDDTHAIHEFQSTGQDIRTDAEKVLTERGVGSWLFRRTSLKNSSTVNSKCVSFYKEAGSIKHIIILQVTGLGYYSTSDVERSATLPGLEKDEVRTSLPLFNTVYPCLIDLIEALQSNYNFTLANYCTH